mgnify:CR=1 FL=1
MKSNKRIEWIDIAKGYGMILVILGHCCYLGKTVHNLIFAFHMPLFFILSSFFAPSDIKSAIKRIFILIKQYLLFILIGFAVTLIIPAWRNSLNLKSVILDTYMLNPEKFGVSSIWFLASLGVVIAMFVIIRLTKKVWLQITAFILMAAMGFIFAQLRCEYFSFLPAERLPGNFDVSLVAILFYAIGFYCKDIIFQTIDFLKKKTWLSLIITLFGGVLFFVLVKLNGRVNLHGLTFNNVALFIITAILGSFIFILICSFLESSVLGSLGSCIGRNTVIILGLQALLVRLYILIVNLIFNTDYRLYFLPIHHAITSFLIITFGICIPVCLLSDKIKEKKHAKG